MSTEQESNAVSKDELRADEEQNNIPIDDTISQNDMNNVPKDDGTIEELVDGSFSGYDEEIVVEDGEDGVGDGEVVEVYRDAVEEEGKFIEEDGDVVLEDGEDLSEEEIIDEEHDNTSPNKYDDNRSLIEEEIFEEEWVEESVNDFGTSGYYDEEILDEDEEDDLPRMPTLVEDEEDNIDSTSVPDLNVDLEDTNVTEVPMEPISEQEAVPERILPRGSSSFKVVTPLRTTIIVGAPLSPEKIPNRNLEGGIASDVPLVPFLDDSQNQPNMQEPDTSTTIEVEPSSLHVEDNMSIPVETPIPAEETQTDNQKMLDQSSVEDTQTIENNDLPMVENNDLPILVNNDLPIPVEETQSENQTTMHPSSVEDRQELENEELMQQRSVEDAQEIGNAIQDENNQEINDVAKAEEAKEVDDISNDDINASQDAPDFKPESSKEPIRNEEPPVDSKASRIPFATWFNRSTPVADAAPQKIPEPKLLPQSPQSPKPFDESMADENVVTPSSDTPVAFTNIHVVSPDNNTNDQLSPESELALEIKRLEEEINNIQNKSLRPRPYDEFIEKDDPTDEWEGRSEEAAKLAKASYRKPTNQFVAAGEIPKESIASSPNEEATAVKNRIVDLDDYDDDDEAAEWTEMEDKGKPTHPDGFDPTTLSLPAQNNDDASGKPHFLAAPFAKEFADNSEHNPNTVRSADKVEEVAPYQVSNKKSNKDDEKSIDDETKASASEQSFLGSRKFTILVCILTVIVIALAIVLGVLLGGNSDDNDRDIVIPTPSPGSTPSPTFRETLSPTVTSPRVWQPTDVISSAFSVTSFGQTAAIGTTQLAVGAPEGLGNGAVFTYQNKNGSWSNTITSQLFGEQPGDQFGKSITMTNNMLVVGAPFVVSPGTTTPVGAVYVYGYFGENNTTENTFQPFGNSTLFSGSGIFAAYEEFGSSVSVNEDNSFIVVGAPKSSTQVLNATGRFYIYQLNGLGTSWDMIFNQTGSVANGYFGTSVDISNDGSHCVVGAPFAGNGSVSLYSNTGSTWQLDHEVQGGEAGFGSVVQMLTTNGSIFAVGNPSFQQNSGLVIVYTIVDTELVQQGQPIVGTPGELLGTINMITAGSLNGTSIILGTGLGEIKQYDYNFDSQTWVEAGKSILVTSSFTQVSTSSNTDLLIVGAEDEALVYEFSYLSNT